MTVHIESKKEDIAEVVIMPGDPLRAKYIAEKFLIPYNEKLYAFAGIGYPKKFFKSFKTSGSAFS